MLRSIRELDGYLIQAMDGKVGYAHDFFFDDRNWLVRYLVVDTGIWLVGRKVLIWPRALGLPDWKTSTLPVELTKEQIENSPDIDTDQPISRQQEVALFEHYRWPPYWRDVTPVSAGMAGMRTESYLEAMAAASVPERQAKKVAAKSAETEHEGNPYLRSANEVHGYYIQAIDDDIGHVEDFIVEDEFWAIRYIVVDTRNWLPGGKKVLISPAWITQVNWAENKVFVDLSKQAIENCPEYNPSDPINREYEVRLYDFYGRPAYWQ